MSNQQGGRGNVAATGMAALAEDNVAAGAGGDCDLGCSKEGSVSTNPNKKGFSRLKQRGNKRGRNTCQETQIVRDLRLNFR